MQIESGVVQLKQITCGEVILVKHTVVKHNMDFTLMDISWVDSDMNADSAKCECLLREGKKTCER